MGKGVWKHTFTNLEREHGLMSHSYTLCHKTILYSVTITSLFFVYKLLAPRSFTHFTELQRAYCKCLTERKQSAIQHNDHQQHMETKSNISLLIHIVYFNLFNTAASSSALSRFLGGVLLHHGKHRVYLFCPWHQLWYLCMLSFRERQK